MRAEECVAFIYLRSLKWPSGGPETRHISMEQSQCNHRIIEWNQEDEVDGSHLPTAHWAQSPSSLPAKHWQENQKKQSTHYHKHIYVYTSQHIQIHNAQFDVCTQQPQSTQRSVSFGKESEGEMGRPHNGFCVCLFAGVSLWGFASSHFPQLTFFWEEMCHSSLHPAGDQELTG